ncbi:MRN complex-interacting protein isoform X2 [Pipistrellus kuhlii]|uniref:MRN complex interacting protein n=1 Tax=Pipistrellus kuhlii TaxID=59472 RepID=A0A7J7UAB3_PIPKU|nr:MRN complex-interacting protein isoform X2 [Pipistrellus kuhlii]KAF6309765.1 MRN complex interacting protein [Pipistrellus kuhlii]
MAPPPQARVLRCCRCRLFQAHQMKKSLKWTCKACGEKQSFLRAYGEGSGADCRRHVQKLNLLQGQLSEMSPRSLREPINADEENTENAGSAQAEHVRLQDHAGPAGPAGEGSSREDGDARQLPGPWREPLRPAQQVRATSKWERFLLPLGTSHVDTAPPTPLQRDPRPAGAAQAEQGSPRAQTAEDRGLSRTPNLPQLPWASHTATSRPRRPLGETPEQWGTGPQAEGGPLVKGAHEARTVQLCDLFTTGEDFDDAVS